MTCDLDSKANIKLLDNGPMATDADLGVSVPCFKTEDNDQVDNKFSEAKSELTDLKSAYLTYHSIRKLCNSIVAHPRTAIQTQHLRKTEAACLSGGCASFSYGVQGTIRPSHTFLPHPTEIELMQLSSACR